MQLVREVETGKSNAWAVQRKYDIKGANTVMRWVRQFGSGNMVNSFEWKKLMKSMRRRDSEASCGASRKPWPIRMWSWRWSRRFWRWPARSWARAGGFQKKTCWRAAHQAVEAHPS